MPRPVFAILLLLAFSDARAQAQAPAAPPKATEAMIIQALEQLEAKVERRGPAFIFTIQQRPLELRMVAQGNKIFIRTTLDKHNPALETLNRYNEELAITTRALRNARQAVVFEAGHDCTLGISPEGIRRFILGFVAEIKGFEQFLAKHEGKVAPALPTAFPLVITPGTDEKEVEITFPSGDASKGETAWRIVWDMHTAEDAKKEGFRFPDSRQSALLLFRIKKAYFRPGAKAPWMQVLDDVHPSEFYVPYFFQNTRFFDLRDVGNYTNLGPKDGGPRSRALGKDRRVMAELRDRGVVYKYGSITRRGEELVLWANFVAGNYTYLVEFGFNDDGTVALRHAPTGYNFFSHFDEAAHMHNVLWRIGVKLGVQKPGKPMNQQVDLVKLPYDPKALGPQGKLDVSEITRESFHDWNAKEFTRLRITNPDVTVFPLDGKKPGRPICYEIVPTLSGQARHYRHKDEGFSEHDFWVTRADCPEKLAIYIHEYFGGRVYNGKKSAPQPLAGSDGVVVWHTSSVLHVPRGEDGILNGAGSSNGQALASWTSVELRPRNLFIKTPIYSGK